ncbi:putative entry exclusion protein TrbK-alt [Caulobacter flavus]
MVLIAAAMAGQAASRATPKAKSAVQRTVDADLARCRNAGEAAAQDERCQAAWRGARARFFGRPAA